MICFDISTYLTVSTGRNKPYFTSQSYFSFILREYHIHAGKTEMAASLKTQFPGEEKAIDEFMRLMKVEREGGNDNNME